MSSSKRHGARNALLVGVALMGLAALAYAGWRAYEVRVARPAAVFPRLAWPQGERQVFRLTYRSSDEARPIVEEGASTAAADPISSRLELEARVAVTGEGMGAADGTRRLRFEVLSCERGSWQIAGGVAWSDAAQCEAMLVGPYLGIEVDASGETTALYDPAAADTSAQSVLQALWLRMQAALPDGPMAEGETYWAQEKTLQGLAANVYRVSAPEPGSGFRLERTTDAYLDVRAAAGLRLPPRVEATGAASFSIDARGLLRSGKGDESLAVQTADGISLLASQSSFEFEWLRREDAAPTLDFAVLEPRAPTSALVGADVKAKLLDSRIAGLDLETLLANVRSSAGIRGANDARFLWQATGFLERHPEAARELLALYRSPGASADARARVLDLLASVGHDEAQAAMRAALGDPGALAGGGVAARHLYQRLGLLEHPNPETAEMVAGHYRALQSSGSLEAELTTAYSLAAIAGKLARGDDEARSLAAAYNAELAGGLRSTTDPTELAHRVAALGNARLAENIAVFSDLAQHESPAVRREVAQALGKVETESPPDALLGLMSDADPVVQRNAVRGASPADEIYRQLAQEVSAGGVPQLNVRPILDLVKQGRRTHPQSTTVLLDALIAQGIDDDKNRQLALLLEGE
jgi:hypothetical protein